MSVDFKPFSQSPDNIEREFNKKFLAEGLKKFAPIAVVGDIPSAKEYIRTAFPDEIVVKFLATLNECTARLSRGESISTLELYEDGFNAFVRRRGFEHAVGVFRWRNT